MNITETSIKRPSLIIVLYSVLALLGIIGYKNLSYELMPDFNQPVVVIKTMYPGAEPEEVESSVSKKIEDALSNLEGVDYLITKSLPNASIIIANLKYGTNLDKTMQDAQRYIDNIKKDLPEDIQSPVMSKVSPNDLPIMSVSANSSESSTEFYQLMKDQLLPQIKQIKGVAEITLLGGQEREIQVSIYPDKLKLYQVSLIQVVEVIKRSGINLPSGQIDNNQNKHAVRLSGKFQSLEDIENIQIAMPSYSNPVYLKDIADISDGIKETSSISRFNGKNGIGLLIKKQGDANAVEVSAAIKKQFTALERQHSASNIHFTIADDSTDNTIAAVNSVVLDLFLAVALVSIVMLLFLRSLRNALIVLIAIPSSLITAFAVMWLLGYTLNLMTLLAMSLIIGILVDDAVVVLENIQRHLDKGKNKMDAAMDGRMEIGFAALSITLVDVVVFLPILFLQVFVADMLKQFSVVVITSTLTSLLVGFTLTPWLASRLGKKDELKNTNFFNRLLIGFEHQLDTFTNWYAHKLNWVLNHKIIFTLFLLLLFVLTLATMKQGIIGKELISTGDQGKFRLNLEYDQATSIQSNDKTSQKIESFILHQKAVKSLFSNVGGPSTGIGSLGIGSANKTEFTVQLKNKNGPGYSSTEDYMKWLRDTLKNTYPGINFSMSALGLIPRSAPIEITLNGNNTDAVMEAGNQLKNIIENIPGADNVQLSVEAGNPEYKIIPDKDKMQKFGITTAYAGMNLRTAFAGNNDANLTENGTEIPIRIWLKDFSRTNLENIKKLAIINPAGLPIEVSQFAEVIQDRSPSMLERKDRQAAITLTADALGRPSGTVADDVVAYLKTHPLDAGITMTWGSDIKRQNDSFGALGSVLLISFLLIYLILVALYDSFVYPFVVLFSIPVAIIGAFLALNLSMSHLSLFALLGLIMLMGLVVKNAILIVDFTNQLKADGMHYRQALIEAGKARMRPILMTTLSMIVGMLPIAMATGTAAEWKNGLAWVIIGGLLSSLILTVFLVPVIYYVLDRLKEKRNSKHFPKQEKIP